MGGTTSPWTKLLLLGMKYRSRRSSRFFTFYSFLIRICNRGCYRHIFAMSYVAEQYVTRQHKRHVGASVRRILAKAGHGRIVRRHNTDSTRDRDTRDRDLRNKRSSPYQHERLSSKYDLAEISGSVSSYGGQNFNLVDDYKYKRLCCQPRCLTCSQTLYIFTINKNVTFQLGC